MQTPALHSGLASGTFTSSFALALVRWVPVGLDTSLFPEPAHPLFVEPTGCLTLSGRLVSEFVAIRGGVQRCEGGRPRRRSSNIT